MSYVSSVSSVTTTWHGKLWWEQWQGAEGAIYGSIDGDVKANPWEVDNSFRVICTVAIRALRYSRWSLADMRIHDINLVADLTAHDPNDPFPYDGTYLGVHDETSYEEVEFNAMSAVTQHFVAEWGSEVWPTLHIKIISATIIVLHILIDLLLSISAHSETIVNFISNVFGIEFPLFEYFYYLVLDKLDDVVEYVIGTFLFGVSLNFFAIFDNTAAQPALVMGSALWLLSALSIMHAASLIATLADSYLAGGGVWLTILLMILTGLDEGLSSRTLSLTNKLVDVMERCGHTGLRDGKFIRYGWTYRLMQFMMCAVAIFGILWYGYLYETA